MKILFETLTHPGVKALSWTLLHLIWQASVLAALFRLFLFLTKNSSALLRYRTGMFTLGAIVILALTTFVYYYLGQPLAGPARVFSTLPTGADTSMPLLAEADPPVAEFGRILYLLRGGERYLPLLVVIWLAGLVVMSIRLTGGLLYVQQLKTSHIRPLPDSWQARINELAEQLHLSRRVQLAESAQVRVPITIGYIRPVILLPVGLLTGLPISYLEAILLHELAHIVRNDYWVNIFQSLLETLLFFHPAVWWISAVVRREREYCCDDIAVRMNGDVLTYLEALASIDAGYANNPLTIAATGHRVSLLERAERLVNQRKEVPALSSAPVGLVTTGFAVLILLLHSCIGFSLKTNDTGNIHSENTSTPIPGSTNMPDNQEFFRIEFNYLAYDQLDDIIAVLENEKALLYSRLIQIKPDISADELWNSRTRNSSATSVWEESILTFQETLQQISELKRRRDALMPVLVTQSTSAKSHSSINSQQLFQALEDALLQDGLIRKGEVYTFRFNYRRMYVNGTVQPRSALEKYKAIARSFGVEKNGPQDRYISKE
jgi:Zn-dependent protease with chaperone function